MPGRSAFIRAVTSLALLPTFTPSRILRATVSSISCVAFVISVTCSRDHSSRTFFSHGSSSAKTSPMAIFLNAFSSRRLNSESDFDTLTMAPRAGPFVPGTGSRSSSASTRGTIMGTAIFAYSFHLFDMKRFMAAAYCRSSESGYFHFRPLRRRNLTLVMPPARLRSFINLLVGIIYFIPPLRYAPAPSPSSLSRSIMASSSTLVSSA